MIIYPIIILVLLFAAFALVWRKAYLIDSGKVDKIKKEDRKGADLSFWDDLAKADEEEDLRELKEKEKESREAVKEGADEGAGEIEAEVKIEIESNFKKAEELFFKKQHISAEKWYLEAVKADPKNPKIYSRLGVIYLEQRNFKDAQDALKEAIKLEPLASRYFNLSYAYYLGADFKEATDSAKRATRMDLKNEKYRKWYNDLKSEPF